MAEDALTEFVELELSGLRRTAYLMTGSWPAADRAVEDALVDLANRGTDFADSPRALAAVRKHLVRTDASSTDLVDTQRARTEDPSDRVLTALGQLLPEHRAAIVLWRFAGLGDAELAAALDRTDAAQMRGEALAALREQLAKTGDVLVLEDERPDASFARPRGEADEL